MQNCIPSTFLFGFTKWKQLPIRGFKGFDRNLRCRNYQYEIGKTFHCDGNIKICSNGFHFCRIPHKVLNYYQFQHDRYAEVIGWDVVEKDDKCAAACIEIVREISLHELQHWHNDNISITIEQQIGQQELMQIEEFHKKRDFGCQ